MIEHWQRKFRNALRGLALGVRGQSSFLVHFSATAAVVATAFGLSCQLWQWCVLLLCISSVLTAELMNSAVEFLAKGLCQEENQQVGAALDIASGSVLCASLFAALIGGLIFSLRILSLFTA